jgi:hypothetical protein
MTRTLVRTACILVLSCAATVAIAHHNGNLYFDGEKTIEFENATVVSMVMVNPHARLEFTIENENGETEEWSAETQSQNALRRKGIHPGLVKAGDVVTVIGNPSRKGTAYIRMRHLILPNGDTVTFYGSGPAITPANP